MFLRFIALALCFAGELYAGDISLQDSDSTKAELNRELSSAQMVVEKSPTSANAYINRGMSLFAIGKIEDALADFDKAIELSPGVAEGLWQRGIALYYLGRFQDAADQFRIHHKVNPDDVENTAWFYLCTAKAKSIEQAKSAIIPSRGDSRTPMLEIMQMHQGSLSPESLASKIEDADRQTRFYGYLYIGLYLEAHGQSEKATRYVQQAVEQERGGYMLRVAKVDLALRKMPVESKSNEH